MFFSELLIPGHGSSQRVHDIEIRRLGSLKDHFAIFFFECPFEIAKVARHGNVFFV
jgi:hypothetical protein